MERGCVEDQPQHVQRAAAVRSDTAALHEIKLRHQPMILKCGLPEGFRVSSSAMRFFSIAGLITLLVSGNAGAASDWPQYRGPQGDGATRAKKVPITWSETNNLAWKISLPGRGRSSPVVSGDRIWLTFAVEQGLERVRIKSDDMQTAEHVSLEVVCLDARNGKILWRTKLFDVDKPDPVHWYNSWATPTPVIEAGRLYCDFGTFGTACVNAKTGDILWKTRVPLEHQVGPGSSPVLYKKLLVLVRDGCDAQYVTALDKSTGKPEDKSRKPQEKPAQPEEQPKGNSNAGGGKKK